MFHAQFIKKASTEEHDLSDYRKLEEIMGTVYSEAPWKWPHGLSIKGHDESFLIKRSSDDTPVGFVGWQLRKEGHLKVGYYSVGVLPEFRGQRSATQAVGELITKKSHEVDKVKALIVEGNSESVGLAKNLDVEVSMTKLASPVTKKLTAGKAILSLLGAAGGTALLDTSILKERGTVGRIMGNPDADKWALPGTIGDFTALTLGGILAAKGRGMAGTGVASLAPLTTMYSAGVRNLGDANVVASRHADALERDNDLTNSLKNLGSKAAIGAGILGGGALAVSGLHALAKRRMAKAQEESARIAADSKSKGSLTVTLPPKGMGGVGTQVNVPFEQIEMTDALGGRVKRDFRRRLYEGTDNRTRRRDPSDRETKKKASDVSETTKQESPADRYASQVSSEAKVLAAENSYKKQQLESEQIERTARTQDAIRRAKKMALAKKQVESLSVMKKANYDPNISQAKGMNMPKGAPASMAYSTVAPYSIHNKPADDAVTPSTDSGDLSKKMEKLEQENINLKIQQEARKLADKQMKSTSTGTGEGFRESLANLKMSLGGIKTASMLATHPVYKAVPEGKPTGGPINTKQLDQGLVESARRTAPGGLGDGIQTSLNFRPYRFGPGVHNLAYAAKKGFFPARPSRGAFLEGELGGHQSMGWAERLQGLVGNLADTYMNPQGGYNPYGY